MEITFVGIGYDAALILPLLERNIPAHYLGVSSTETTDIGVYKGDKIRFSLRPSVDAAALRILPKIKKRTKNAEIVFLLSEMTGKAKEDIICNIAEGLEDKILVSVVWYPKRKHGQHGVRNSIDRLGENSSVIAIPQAELSKVVELVVGYVEQILFMYRLPYANAEKDTGKRTLYKGGLLHIIQDELEIMYLNHRFKGMPWGISDIRYNQDLDTCLEYGRAALLHLTVPQGTDPRVIQYICEYVVSSFEENCELNFSITVTPEPGDSVGLELLVTDTVTATEVNEWF